MYFGRFAVVHIGGPSSNQAVSLESQMIHQIQLLFGRTLTDGTFYKFDDPATCQRSALLLVGGSIYAGFRGNESSKKGSTVGRGWLLGWTASTLAPLMPLLTNGNATAANSMFLTSIWMSGSGIASDGANLYFTTGNSDSSGTSSDPVNNVEELTFLRFGGHRLKRLGRPCVLSR